MTRNAALTLESKVAFLRRRDSYPDQPARVKAIQTHMSWVFLTAHFAYKLKKPIRRGTLDYHSLAARLRNCRREVRLNRRLAADVYVGLVALTRDKAGRLHLDGEGRVVEWLVKMRRLPEQRTLHSAIVGDRLGGADVRAVAARLVAFFDSAAHAATSAVAYCRRFDRLIRQTRKDLARPGYGLQQELLDRLAGAQRNFLVTNSSLLGARAARVVEGHGDLRPEHVYLGEEPLVTDCLEFSRRLRLHDPVDELAFLGMECERIGAPAISASLIASYRSATGDLVDSALVDFYACCQACLRARLAAWHLDEPQLRNRAKWRRRTHQYLAIALRHSRALAELRPARARHALRGTAPARSCGVVEQRSARQVGAAQEPYGVRKQ